MKELTDMCLQGAAKKDAFLKDGTARAAHGTRKRMRFLAERRNHESLHTD